MVMSRRALVDSHEVASAEEFFVSFMLRRALVDSHCACFSDFSNSIKWRGQTCAISQAARVFHCVPFFGRLPQTFKTVQAIPLCCFDSSTRF